jgi:hypothetical protein
MIEAQAVPAVCELHRDHQPRYTYAERHHIIPQAWQAVWQPPTFVQRTDSAWPFAHLSPDHKGLFLWDARTANICRTGHGNVHFYLVRLMLLLQAGQPTLHLAKMEVLRELGHADSKALDAAQQAIERFIQAGGVLASLWAADEFGAI